ncbi:MAG TPA: response regulator [Acidobacteriaceae bacterium]|nr:response regulator [Acidobacteriaceae bacterium]
MGSRKIAILCVDDEEIPRTLRILVLRKQGYEVTGAASGAEAMELLGSQNFDLVLTDQMMPEMTGTELTRRLKSVMPEMPVVIISGMNELPAGAELADAFVSKVAGPAALFESLTTVLERYQRSF